MPFIAREPKKQSFFRRLLGCPNIDALAADLEGLLAKRWPDNLPTRNEVAIIEARHSATFSGKGVQAGRSLLAMAADAVTSSLPFTVPLLKVSELANSLALAPEEAQRAVQSSGRLMLRREVQRALGDERITQQERDSFRVAADAVGIDSAEVTAAIIEGATSLFRERLDAALSDGMLSPVEERALAQLAANLGLNPEYDSNRQGAIERARELWTVMHGPLPNVEPPFYLQKGEQCTFTVDAEAFEQRTRTRSITYGGPAVSIPIVKGLRIRVGHSRVHRSSEDYHHTFGRGALCLTNKRLIWNGPNKNVAIKLTKILDFEPYTDGVRIEKDTGKPLLFVFSQPAQNLGPLLSRLLDEARQ
jgi:hypothetical protein